MRYDEFRTAWQRALQECGFRDPFGPAEKVDREHMARDYRTVVEPIGGQQSPPFHVTAQLGFRWDAILTARGVSTEEDFLMQVLGNARADKIRTERPWLRADVVLRASLPGNKPLPMPKPAVWARWVEEAMTRLEAVERLVPDEVVREKKGGRHEYLAWAAEQPEVATVCARDGRLLITGIELASWNGVELPRRWDNPSRREDPHPHDQLVAMFQRVRSSLHAWMEVMDHLG